MKEVIRHVTLFMFLFAGFNPVRADTITHTYSTEEVNENRNLTEDADSRKTGKNKFDRELYKKATEGLDYKEKTPDPPKFEFKPQVVKGFLGIGQILLIIAIVALLIVMVYFISRSIPVSNPSVGNDEDWISSVMENENGPDNILQPKLEDALAEGNYSLAVRILYLQVLVQLNQHKLIVWKKDKTDSDYISELRPTGYHADFRNLTRVYEYAWFSDTPTDSDGFRKIKPLFDSFREMVGKTDLKEG